MVISVNKEKGDIIGQGKSGGTKWVYKSCLFLVFLSIGVLLVLGVSRSFAQVSQNTVAYAYTGNATPPIIGFTPVFSEQSLKAGPLRIHPFLGAAEIYTDNVFRTKGNRQHDFVHILSPGLQVQLPFAGLHQAVVDYRASQWLSQRFSTNNVLRQDLTGQVLFNFPGGLKLHLQGGYVKGFDFRGSAVDLQFQEPTKWNVKNFAGEAENIGSQIGVRLRVRVADRNFTNNNQAPARDRLNSQADFSVFGLIAPKTFALLSIGINRTVYDQNTQLDSVNYRVSTGLRWNATGKTKGEIQVGYEFLNFDHAPVTQPAGSSLSSGGNGRQNLRITGNLNWAPTERSKVQFRPFRVIRQSGVFNTSTFIQTGMSLNARYAIGNRTTIGGSAQYTNNEFTNDQGSQSSQNRTDDLLRGSMRVTYKAVRWLGISAQYQYEQRTSTTSQFEFYANTLMVSFQGFF